MQNENVAHIHCWRKCFKMFSTSKHPESWPSTIKVCHLAWQSTLHCVPCSTVSHSATVSTCPLCVLLDLVSAITHKHTYFGCQGISDTKNINIKQKFNKVLNLYFDLDLDTTIQFLPDTPANDDVPSH